MAGTLLSEAICEDRRVDECVEADVAGGASSATEGFPEGKAEFSVVVARRGAEGAGEGGLERATDRGAVPKGAAGCDVEEITEGVIEGVTDEGAEGAVEGITVGSDETPTGVAADGIDE